MTLPQICRPTTVGLTVIVAEVKDGVGDETSFDEAEEGARRVERGFAVDADLADSHGRPRHHLKVVSLFLTTPTLLALSMRTYLDGDPDVAAKLLRD
jgi:hypothetical protein